MEIELSVYPRKKRQNKRSAKDELQCLKAEVAQLQHRHNQLVKALLALAGGCDISTNVYKSKSDITSDSEADFVSRCFDVDDDDLLTVDEDEILELLRDN